eukprot:g1745.t1
MLAKITGKKKSKDGDKEKEDEDTIPEKEEDEDGKQEEEDDDQEEMEDLLFDDDDDVADKEMRAEAERWSLEHFQDRLHVKDYKIGRDLSDEDVAAMGEKKRWEFKISEVHYEHLWQEGNNDIFLEFQLGHDWKKHHHFDKQTKTHHITTSGSRGQVFRTNYIMNLEKTRKIPFAEFDCSAQLECTYFELHRKYLRILIWDRNLFFPNVVLGAVKVPLSDLVQGNVERDFPIDSQRVTMRKGMRIKEMTPVGVVSIACIVQQSKNYNLNLGKWSLKLSKEFWKYIFKNNEENTSNKLVFMCDIEMENRTMRDHYWKHPSHIIDYDKWNIRTRAKSKQFNGFSRKDLRQPIIFNFKPMRVSGLACDLEQNYLKIVVKMKFLTGVQRNLNIKVGEGSASLLNMAAGKEVSFRIIKKKKYSEKKSLLEEVYRIFSPSKPNFHISNDPIMGKMSGRIDLVMKVVGGKYGRFLKHAAGKIMFSSKSGTRSKNAKMVGDDQKKNKVDRSKERIWRRYTQQVSGISELSVYKPFLSSYLVIKLKKAENIMPADRNGLSDAFVTIAWANQVQRSRVIEGHLNPSWNEVFIFPVPFSNPQRPAPSDIQRFPFVLFTIWDSDFYDTQAECLGYCKLYLADILNANSKIITTRIKKSVHGLVDWLKDIGVSDYADVFLQNEISGDVLIDLNEEDLDYMKIKALGHRKKILKGVQLLKGGKASTTKKIHWTEATLRSQEENKMKPAAHLPVNSADTVQMPATKLQDTGGSMWSLLPAPEEGKEEEKSHTNNNDTQQRRAVTNSSSSSFFDGEYDEEAEHAAFRAAVEEWRNSNKKSSSSSTSTTATTRSVTVSHSGGQTASASPVRSPNVKKVCCFNCYKAGTEDAFISEGSRYFCSSACFGSEAEKKKEHQQNLIKLREKTLGIDAERKELREKIEQLKLQQA